MGLFLNLSGTTKQAFGIKDTNASHFLNLSPGSDLTADRTLSLVTGDADRSITLSGNPTLNDWFDQSVKAAASPSFVQVTVGSAGIRLLEGYIPGLNYLTIRAEGLNLSEDRELIINVSDGDRTITLTGNPTLDDWFNQSVKVGAVPTFAGLYLQDSSAGPSFYLRNTDSRPAVDTRIGGILGYMNDAGNYIPMAAITFHMDAASGANDAPGRIVFATTPDGSATLAERMRITKAGQLLFNDENVNHGITSYGGALTSTYLIIYPATASDGGACFVGYSDNAAASGLDMYGVIGVTDPTDTTVAFRMSAGKKSGTGATTLGDAETAFKFLNWGTQLVTVLGNGFTGFGTVTPYERVEIAGALSVSGHLAGNTSQGPVLTLCYHSSGYGYIQAVDWGVAYKDLAINPSGGKVCIGHAAPTQVLDVSGAVRVGYNRLRKLGLYAYSTTDSLSNRYVHLKTNQPCSSGVASPMMTVRYTGYEYQSPYCINTVFCWYSYLGNVTQKFAQGTHNCSGYKSADDYVVLTLFLWQTYYAGFIMDAFSANPDGIFDLSIVASTHSASATGVY